MRDERNRVSSRSIKQEEGNVRKLKAHIVIKKGPLHKQMQESKESLKLITVGNCRGAGDDLRISL
jgi:hypothetical protein